MWQNMIGGRPERLWPMVMLLLAFLLVPNQASAKEGEFGLSISAGTGYLIGYTASDSVSDSLISSRQPTLLDLDFQYEVLDWLAPSLRVEMTVEGSEALTLVPNVVFDSNGNTLSFFGRVGVAIRIRPNYYGLDVGAGLVWHFIRHMGLSAELNLEPLFLGDGLTGGFVMPIILFVGLRGNV